jgi:hypothetical protein
VCSDSQHSIVGACVTALSRFEDSAHTLAGALYCKDASCTVWVTTELGVDSKSAGCCKSSVGHDATPFSVGCSVLWLSDVLP